jgi:uncharacterized protein (TIGR03435 family)
MGRAMTFRLKIGFLGALACLGVFGDTHPRFEAASIRRPGTAQVTQSRAGVRIDGTRITWTYLSLKDYLGIAYGLRNYQISGPDWIALERFDITATVSAGAGPEEVPQMLQTLLEERFKMKTHREIRELSVYCLVLGNDRLKLRESSADLSPKIQGAKVAVKSSPGYATVNYGNGSYFTFADNRIEGRKLRITAMADGLSRFTDRPVIDMTNLKRHYDFVLDLAPEDFRAMRIRSAMAAGVAITPRAVQQAKVASGASLFNAIENLGLKLEPRNAPVELLVIDHIQKLPTSN